jgi:phosphopantothenoylcysteine decarboxylase/phosphopantothenate--cysteine ligase
MVEPSDNQGWLGGYEVLLCLSGGIACYKVADLASKLRQESAGVTVAMTPGARRFVAPLTFQTLTNRPVYVSLWQRSSDFRSQHLSLTEQADLMVIAPATANVMAKLACGLADDLVSAMGLSAWGSCPVLLAPAMNTRMWQASPMQANLARLREWGCHFVGPAEGLLACQTIGIGRMSEVPDILEAIRRLLLARPPKRLAETTSED